MVLAQTKDQAQSSFNFIVGAIEAAPALRGLISSRTADTLSLTTKVDIIVRPASFRSVRGVNLVAAIADEVAFWRSDESQNPDVEIVRALRPALMNTKGPLIAISSPYARKGHLWTTYSKHFGKEGSPVLVAQASSQTMNRDVDQSWIDGLFDEDPISAEAEINAQFRNDVDSFIDRDVVERAVIRHRVELPYSESCRYIGFVDPSGGSGKDSFTLAIAHADSATVVIDAIREIRPPMSPDSVCEEFAALLKSYRIHSVTGDNFADEWPRERFRAHGIQYIKADKNKSALYIELLPLLNSGRIQLLDNDRLLLQICQLERRNGTSGRDIIDHPRGPSFHDDVANAVAGAAVLVAAKKLPIKISDEALNRFKRAPQWGPHGRQSPDPRAVDVHSLLSPMMGGRQ